MVIGSFADTENRADTTPEPGDADEETTPEPSVVDVRVRYALIRQKVLEELITDLNANSHSMLTIKENGDIVVSCQKKKILKATPRLLSGKNLLEGTDLHFPVERVYVLPAVVHCHRQKKKWRVKARIQKLIIFSM